MEPMEVSDELQRQYLRLQYINPKHVEISKFEIEANRYMIMNYVANCKSYPDHPNASLIRNTIMRVIFEMCGVYLETDKIFKCLNDLHPNSLAYFHESLARVYDLEDERMEE